MRRLDCATLRSVLRASAIPIASDSERPTNGPDVPARSPDGKASSGRGTIGAIAGASGRTRPRVDDGVAIVPGAAVATGNGDGGGDDAATNARLRINESNTTLLLFLFGGDERRFGPSQDERKRRERERNQADRARRVGVGQNGGLRADQGIEFLHDAGGAGTAFAPHVLRDRWRTERHPRREFGVMDRVRPRQNGDQDGDRDASADLPRE